ncbi:MAG: cyclodeaminase/cyclohydrolase family protein [Lachnospiraceae bacterium]|nr:cyclodeaminase/cyclohydrolase family protein [Lachnospiraceae bacterium]MDY4970228.1 cyclodeaminase/cyclohydrolase family protein [Lachnospiraceae bacterium]
MKLVQASCVGFVDETFSKAPVPGGGGVAALAGALGTALGGMVCNLTTGKKKYAQYEEDIQRIMKEAEALKNRLLELIDEDAQNFFPLSKAYGLPKNTEEEKKIKEETLQKCLKVAIQGPVDIMKVCYDAIKLQEELVDKGSMLAISDVGCGVLLLKGAMQSGWLNVVVNLNSITDEKYVADLRAELVPLMDEGCRICDEVYEKVLAKLG